LAEHVVDKGDTWSSDGDVSVAEGAREADADDSLDGIQFDM